MKNSNRIVSFKYFKNQIFNPKVIAIFNKSNMIFPFILKYRNIQSIQIVMEIQQEMHHPPYVTIQYCINCNTHSWCTHHNQQKYQQAYLDLEYLIKKTFPNAEVIGNKVPKNMVPVKANQNKFYDKKTNKYVIFPSIGALQVVCNGKTLFSKKQKNAWPNLQEVITKMKQMLNPGLINIQSNSQKVEKLKQSKIEQELQTSSVHTVPHFKPPMNQLDKNLTFYPQHQNNSFTLTDHFKRYKMKKNEENDSIATRSEISEGRISKITAEDIKQLNKKTWGNQQNLPSFIKNKAYIKQDNGGKKEMLVNLSSIEQQNEQNKISYNLKNNKNSIKRISKLGDQIKSFQKRFSKFQRKVEEVNNKRKEFQIFSQVKENNLQNSRALKDSRKSDLSKFTTVDRIHEFNRNYNALDILKQIKDNKNKKIEEYINATSQQKNEKLSQIYGPYIFSKKKRSPRKRQTKSNNVQFTNQNQKCEKIIKIKKKSSYSKLKKIKPMNSGKNKVKKIVTQSFSSEASSSLDSRIHGSEDSNVQIQVSPQLVEKHKKKLIQAPFPRKKDKNLSNKVIPKKMIRDSEINQEKNHTASSFYKPKIAKTSTSPINKNNQKDDFFFNNQGQKNIQQKKIGNKNSNRKQKQFKLQASKEKLREKQSLSGIQEKRKYQKHFSHNSNITQVEQDKLDKIYGQKQKNYKQWRSNINFTGNKLKKMMKKNLHYKRNSSLFQEQQKPNQISKFSKKSQNLQANKQKKKIKKKQASKQDKKTKNYLNKDGGRKITKISQQSQSQSQISSSSWSSSSSFNESKKVDKAQPQQEALLQQDNKQQNNQQDIRIKQISSPKQQNVVGIVRKKKKKSPKSQLDKQIVKNQNYKFKKVQQQKPASQESKIRKIVKTEKIQHNQIAPGSKSPQKRIKNSSNDSLVPKKLSPTNTRKKSVQSNYSGQEQKINQTKKQQIDQNQIITNKIKKSNNISKITVQKCNEKALKESEKAKSKKGSPSKKSNQKDSKKTSKTKRNKNRQKQKNSKNKGKKESKFKKLKKNQRMPQSESSVQQDSCQIADSDAISESDSEIHPQKKDRENSQISYNTQNPSVYQKQNGQRLIQKKLAQQKEQNQPENSQANRQEKKQKKIQQQMNNVYCQAKEHISRNQNSVLIQMCSKQSQTDNKVTKYVQTLNFQQTNNQETSESIKKTKNKVIKSQQLQIDKEIQFQSKSEIQNMKLNRNKEENQNLQTKKDGHPKVEKPLQKNKEFSKTIPVERRTLAKITQQFYGNFYEQSIKSVNNILTNEDHFVEGGFKEFSKCIQIQNVFKRKLKGNQFSKFTFLGAESIQIEQVVDNSGQMSDLIKILKILANKSQFLIIRLFENSKITHYQRKYGVWLCDNFQWKCFVVDDMVDVDQNQMPLHLDHKNNQFWPIILLKALSQLFGSYQKLREAPCGLIFHALTGCNNISLRVKEQAGKNQQLLRFISSNERKNFILTATKRIFNSINENIQEQMNKPIYYILSQKSINQNQILIRMKKNNSDAFWIKFDKFIVDFHSVDVLQLRVNHNFFTMQISNLHSGKFHIYQLNFEESGFGCISVCAQKGISSFKVYLYKEEEDNVMKLVGQAKQKNKRNLFFDCNFESCKYFLFVQMCSNEGRISFMGETKPSIITKEQIKGENLRNDYTEYVPVESMSKKKTIQMPQFLSATMNGNFMNSEKDNQSVIQFDKMSRISKQSNSVFKKNLIKQQFIEYLLQNNS